MEAKTSKGKVLSSFRDPSGYVYKRGGLVFRQVNKSYKRNYGQLMGSGLYQSLVDSKLLIPHKEVDLSYSESAQAYKVILPTPLPFISYPYEWSFSQLKDAAEVTLKIQRRALASGMSLKDASSFNIQFLEGKPTLIDTLSFEKYGKGEPWVAYRQFCEMFLAPLALMSHKDITLNQLLRVDLAGVPLGLASKLLPIQTYLDFGLTTHIHLHAKGQAFFANKTLKSKSKLREVSIFGLIESLSSSVQKLRLKSTRSLWSEYERYGSYSKLAAAHKKELVTKFLGKGKQKMVWDLGANEGAYSRLAAQKADFVVSIDSDPVVVEKNYLISKKEGIRNVLPLVIDLTNPSPSTGWGGEERLSLGERGPADVVLALALIHHLAISNNTPISFIASFLSKICKGKLIIEFVPKKDKMVEKLLSVRRDIFFDYRKEKFEEEFKKFFRIRSYQNIHGTKRVLYLMDRK